MNKQEEIVSRYYGGESVIKLAKEYGLSRERIYQYLRKTPGFKEISVQKRQEKVEQRLDQYRPLFRQIVQMREDGLGVTHIAKELGVTYFIVKKLLKDTQWEASKKANAKRNRAINNAYKKGLSQVKIAEKFGLSQSSISSILLKLNDGRLPERPRNRK